VKFDFGLSVIIGGEISGSHDNEYEEGLSAGLLRRVVW
jgi:hypothetical protein